jgi:hypothetical protein
VIHCIWCVEKSSSFELMLNFVKYDLIY